MASKLEGNWKLSSSYNFLNASEVIRADSLPAILPLKLNHELGYHRPNVWAKPEIVLQVDIDLVYGGIEGRQEEYSATYKYDSASHTMLQVKK